GDQVLACVERQLAALDQPRQLERELEHRVEQRRLGRAPVQRLQAVGEVGDRFHEGASEAAWRASASTWARSAPRGTIQLPPTHSTLGSASQSGAVSAEMPPVGQNCAAPSGADSAFSALTPPEVEAGKNLKCVRPRSSPRMISLAV